MPGASTSLLTLSHLQLPFTKKEECAQQLHANSGNQSVWELPVRREWAEAAAGKGTRRETSIINPHLTSCRRRAARSRSVRKVSGQLDSDSQVFCALNWTNRNNESTNRTSTYSWSKRSSFGKQRARYVDVKALRIQLQPLRWLKWKFSQRVKLFNVHCSHHSEAICTGLILTWPLCLGKYVWLLNGGWIFTLQDSTVESDLFVLPPPRSKISVFPPNDNLGWTREYRAAKQKTKALDVYSQFQCVIHNSCANKWFEMHHGLTCCREQKSQCAETLVVLWSIILIESCIDIVSCPVSTAGQRAEGRACCSDML